MLIGRSSLAKEWIVCPSERRLIRSIFLLIKSEFFLLTLTPLVAAKGCRWELIVWRLWRLRTRKLDSRSFMPGSFLLLIAR